ncbi:hypothetical protein GGR92_000281 [Spirosoma lacussanchae]|uniref:hypothetical protein n=1 Tax=Spirosoma lacussanchae TaxID=1884249 RepID=UPI001107DD60|nr:hypothetical protein [Spirosoma lacussanchae]
MATRPTIFVNHKPGDLYFTVSFRNDTHLTDQIGNLEGALWNGAYWEVPVFAPTKRLIDGKMMPVNQLKMVVDRRRLPGLMSYPVDFTKL